MFSFSNKMLKFRMLESLTSFLTGSFLLNKVDSLHGGRRCFPEVKNILFHFILNKVYSFWVEKIKLENIFIFPELDFVRKSRCSTMDQKGVKRAENKPMNYWQWQSCTKPLTRHQGIRNSKRLSNNLTRVPEVT